MRLVLDRLPPLRERVQDILPLTEFFVAKFAASLNKPIDLIPDEVMAVLHARRGDATYHDRLFYLSLEKKLRSRLHRSRAADLIQRIEAAVLAAASERRSEHLRRLAELR